MICLFIILTSLHFKCDKIQINYSRSSEMDIKSWYQLVSIRGDVDRLCRLFNDVRLAVTGEYMTCPLTWHISDLYEIYFHI